MHWASLEDVALDGGELDKKAIMTATERLAIAEDKLVAMEQAASTSTKVSSVGGLAFPFSAEASEQVSALVGGAAALVLLSIQAEQVVLRSAAPTATVADLVGALPPSEPCYALLNYAHERDGAPCMAVVFLYVCPEESPVKLKMLHASSKGSVLQALEAQGVSVAKSLEGVEASDLSSDLLEAELYPPAADDGAMPSITKAAPRGGRKLNSRNKR